MIDPGELGPSARALLDAAREGLSPDAAAVARVRANVGAATGAGAGALSLGTKLGLLGVVAVIALGLVTYATRDHARSPEVAVAPLAAPPPPAPAAPIAQRAPSAASNAADVAPVSPAIEMTPQAARPPVTTAASPHGSHPPTPPASPSTASTTPTSTPHADLAREVALIDLAMAAMRRGDASAALSAIRTHARETAGAGQLAEDASAIEIEALCRLHDPSVATKLDGFDARFPRSAQRSRLTTECP